MPRETLVQLLEDRRRIAGKLAELDSMRRPYADQLEKIEREIFGRLKVMAAAMEGEPVASTDAKSLIPLPSRDRMQSWAAALGLEESSEAQSAKREPGGKLLDHVLRALRHKGPMTRNDLYDHLVTSGITIPGKDPRANLSAHLSNSDKIKRDEEGRWTLVQGEITDEPNEENEKQTPA
jgi:hypothetical protein